MDGWMDGWIDAWTDWICVRVCVGVSAGVELEPRSLFVYEKWAERQAKHFIGVEGGGMGKAKMSQRKLHCL